MDDIQTRVEQASQAQSNRPGHDYLVNDLWREVQNLRQQVAALEGAALEGAAARREVQHLRHQAAALLEALRGVVAVADRNTDVFAKARAALAKAVEPT